MSAVFLRHPENPVLTVKDLPEGVGYFLLNPGAVKFNGEYLLIVDVFHVEGGIVFWIARSKDGIHFTFDPSPLQMPPCADDWEEHGVYDPRITQIGNTYYIVYNSHNNTLGCRIAIAATEDFKNFRHVSLVTQVNNRNGALFPEKINGLYCCLNRPFAGDEKSSCGMQLSFSPDLVFWGKSRFSLANRPCHWDDLKVGAGAPPILTDEGWLVIYHGVADTCAGSIYSLHAAILDKDEPWRVLARTKRPLFYPEAPYEKLGRITNVVFTCNALVEGENIRIYYGAADAAIGMAEMPLADILAACHEEYRFFKYLNP